MKRAILIFIFLLSLAAGCAPDQTTPTLIPTVHTETTSPSETSSPSPLPTQTAVPTETPEPTATLTPQPTATPTPAVISVENGRQLSLSGRLGGGALVGVALSPDGAHTAVLTTVMLQMYAVEDGKLLWESPTERVYVQIGYANDGSQVVTRTRGGTVQRWDAANGERLGEPLPIVPNTRQVAMSGNGAFLVTLDNFDQTDVWDTTSGERVQTNNGLAYPFGALQAAVSSDGQLFLNSGIDSKMSYQIRLWDIPRGRFLTGLRGLPGDVFDLQFSKDGQYVTALGARVSGGLRGTQVLYLWRAADGALLDVVYLTLDVSTHTFLGDGSTVLAGTADGKVLFVSFRFGERYTYGYLRDQIFAHEAGLVSLSSSSDGTRYASAAVDGSVKVWDVQTAEEIFTTTIAGLALQALPEEWTYEQLEVFARYHYPGTDIAPDGSQIARTSADLQSIELIDLASGEVLRSMQIEIPGYYSAPVFSPDGKTVAAAFDTNRVVFWDVESGLDVLRLTTQHIHPISKLQFSPDGKQLASLGNGELFVWDLEAVRLLHSLAAFRSFTYSPDGAFLITDSQEEGVNIIDARTGRKISLIATDWVNDLDISPDNLLIAAAGYRSPARYEQQNLVYFLDVVERKRIPVIELSGYPTEVKEVCFSPDGELIASIDGYGSIYVWNASAATLLQRFEERAALPAQIRFSPDGSKLLVAGADNSVQIYQIQP